MKKLLLLSLLVLGALGLVACGGGDDDQTTAASETETSIHSAAVKVARQRARPRPHELADSAFVRDFEAERRIARARRRELAADNTADNKSCGYFDRYSFAVVEGDVSCRVARRVMRAYSISRKMPGSWSCGGSDAEWVCVNQAGETVMAWVTCGAWRRSTRNGFVPRGKKQRFASRDCPGWIKRSEAQRRHGREARTWVP